MSQVRVEDVCKTFDAGSGWLRGRARPTAERLKEWYGEDVPAEPEPEDVREPQVAGKGKITALDHVSLTIDDGETISIVGPSGCGKTTLLRVISGLETVDQGRVYYDGQDVTDVAPKDRGIGIVFQNYALYPHMEAKKNLAFFFWMHKRDREVDERVRITSEILGVGFDELLDRKPKALSGGQRQRVAIGRCIIRDPRLFLFDEPLSNLDAKLRVKTRVEIKRLLARFKITSVYVTHDQTEAIALGDRLVVMRQGRIEQVGTYWEVHDRPVNQFVAGFVGIPTMNLFPASIAEGEARLAGGTIPLPEPLRAVVTAGQAVTLGVRPEDVRVGAPGEHGHLAGVVEVVEPIPSDRVQIVHLRAGPLEITASVPLETPVQRGDNLSIRFEPERIHLFDRESERNVRK